jgi:hypothetical protein
MSLDFLFEGFAGTAATLPSPMARHSLNELSKLVQREAGQDDPDNVEKRVWRQSLPVIHLTSAWQVVGRERYGDTDRLMFDVQDIDLYREVLIRSQAHLKLILRDRRFGLVANEYIQIGWVE